VARVAVGEDVDVIGVGILSGAHLKICPRLLELLRAEDAKHILVLAGGTILREDVPVLDEMGVARVFGAQTRLAEIVEVVRKAVSRPTTSEA
jgi:methylmalonyl-CoA mutase C-terminal domain/subunit